MMKRIVSMACCLALLQFALPGVPCIYYGDEAGMEGYRDPFNRGTYPWGKEDITLLDWYRQLGAARGACPALTEGDFQPVDSGEDVVCFVRRDGRHGLLCAVNRSERTRTVFLPPAFAEARRLIGEATVQGRALYLPPYGGVWLQI